MIDLVLLKPINYMLYEINSTTNQPMQLPIDECEEWIWDTLDSTKDCGFEYIKDGNREFLIFNTNDFFADAKALEKIRKTTGMALISNAVIKKTLTSGFISFTFLINSNPVICGILISEITKAHCLDFD
jgi:hypothetical protein